MPTMPIGNYDVVNNGDGTLTARHIVSAAGNRFEVDEIDVDGVIYRPGDKFGIEAWINGQRYAVIHPSADDMVQIRERLLDSL